jgi:hypothetical protein
LYLIRNHNLYFYIDKIINEIYPDGVEDLANVYCKLELVAHECDLSSRLSKCNKSNFNLITEYSFDLTLNVNLELIFNLLEYLIIVILNPVLSLFGIITNLLVMIVVNNIKNLKKAKIKETKKAKDNMFNHIVAHSGFNVLFCTITMLKLINECTTSELFCSSAFNSSAAQWFDIIIIEFMGGLIKLCCNVSYLFITISRMLLFQTRKNNLNRLLEKIINFNMWIYLFILFSTGILLNAYKLFEYKIDSLFFNDGDTSNTNKDFPTDNYNYFSCFYKNDKFMCDFFKTLKLVNSFINNILFFAVTILFDLVLIKNINEKIYRKKIMVQNFKEKEEEQKKKKLSKMVIINNIIYLLSHMPEFLLSLLFIIFDKVLYNICYMDYKCDKIHELTQVFIFISINSQYSINKSFNKVFNESFNNITLKIRSAFYKNSETITIENIKNN